MSSSLVLVLVPPSLPVSRSSAFLTLSPAAHTGSISLRAEVTTTASTTPLRGWVTKE
eukprot:CAMPEP_0173168488 /NCGR_PEP_ID=MMETSP1141-20130122/174_1 /TAXON_ID=483371 /ORGANISM="non described non described, Strain CCMP2298" /LENGTH=56 /DNA_ID=CAMNT_0014090205 /DNA_START=1166 /DNA_END=1336 /DNA_ORIENTATION=-